MLVLTTVFSMSGEPTCPGGGQTSVMKSLPLRLALKFINTPPCCQLDTSYLLCQGLPPRPERRQSWPLRGFPIARAHLGADICGSLRCRTPHRRNGRHELKLDLPKRRLANWLVRWTAITVHFEARPSWQRETLILRLLMPTRLRDSRPEMLTTRS